MCNLFLLSEEEVCRKALQDVNRNSRRKRRPKISVKNYMSDKIDDAVGFINWLGVSDIPLRLAEPVAPLFDFRNLALCDYLPWPAVDRRLGLVREECRRNLYFRIPEFSGFSFHIDIKHEGPFVSDDGTTCLIFAISKAADAILGVRFRLLVVGLDV